MQDTVELRGGPARLSTSMLREFLQYREVLWAFAERIVRVRYKQAAAGVAWAVLQPLLSAAIFALVLGRYAHVPSDGAPYLLFALCGLVPWNYFSTATAQGMDSVVLDAGLVRKVYFPREVLPVAQATAVLVDLVPSLATLTIIALLYGYTPSIYWIALPVVLVVLVVVAVAAALLPAGLNVYYRDVRYIVPFALQLGLFASAVVWPLSRMPSGKRTAWEIVNPVVAVIDSIRRIVLHHEWPRFGIVAIAFTWSCALLLFSYWLFKRLERGFADRV